MAAKMRAFSLLGTRPNLTAAQKRNKTHVVNKTVTWAFLLFFFFLHIFMYTEQRQEQLHQVGHETYTHNIMPGATQFK